MERQIVTIGQVLDNDGPGLGWNGIYLISKQSKSHHLSPYRSLLIPHKPVIAFSAFDHLSFVMRR
jgi:hypothetical protein